MAIKSKLTDDEAWRKKLNGYFIGFCRKVFRWSPAYKEVLERTFVRSEYVDAIVKGKKTRRRVDYHKCEQCGAVILRKNKHVDHIIPVVDRGGWNGSWDVYRDRCHVSAEKLRLLCKRPCHYEKTQKENAERRKTKKQAKEK